MMKCLFNCLVDIGATLTKQKLRLKEIAWFGFVFNKSGMKPDPKKVATIKEVAEVK